MSDKIKLVVIGNGMVGHKFIECLENNQKHEAFQITTFCEEPRAAYDRVKLSSFFEGKTPEELSLVPEGYYEKLGITLLLGQKATQINREKKIIISSNGDAIPYDKLVLATGSYAFVPPIPGNDRKGCFVYRTIEDLQDITEAAKNSKVGAVVGGGLLGLEAAKALKDLGVKTHVLDRGPRPMSRQVDSAGGELLTKKIEEIGVRVHSHKDTLSITDGTQCQNLMSFSDGTELETDIVLFSAGIRPRDDLARDCGLELDQRGGININEYCLTSDPDIYAIGECAIWQGNMYGLVAPGYQMANVACDHLTQSNDNQFTGADMSTKLKLLGVDVGSIGDYLGQTEGALSYSFNDEINDVYKKLIISSDKKKLLGAVLVGDTSEFGNLLQLKLNDMDLPENPEVLILPSLDGDASSALGLDALPDTAQICSCNDVSKADICNAIDEGKCTLADVKDCTQAGTSCGGCVPLVTQLLNSELTKRGVEVNTDLCEHFPYTRQDLYNIIRINKFKTFDEVIKEYGHGDGCEICKPAIASILASCWNEYVLSNEHIGLQDTNDIFLGNMQKDGTYSVVPRVAGGEITPDKLIVLGEVAKEFNLYTKITGGQRIDLFGAQLHQLPLIWKKLVSAGFETGHAYGKSLRTVKSCVGSTWCRYGVDDSVGLAIELENRYKGLRSPHKIKFAVSGCTRECAEAQSKDVGVIATENGWNLYVSGNGGMKPRHADLLASDLDKETLIRYIDRYLMFYVSTADRLQRTSVWLENLEGGIEYVKQVVCEDSLGLAEQFENQMASVIDAYACEWKTTINDEERLKRFKHFINSDQVDSNIIFVTERDQIRPANEQEREKIQQEQKDKEAAI